MAEANIFELSSRTAIVGMSVVFVALFLLSTYMHYFKMLVNKLESSKKPAAAQQKQKPPSAPQGSAAKTAEPAATTKTSTEGELIAALAATGLMLKGVLSGSDAELAAVIGAALHLEETARGGARALPQPPGAPLNWAMAGRLMSHRLRHQSGMRAYGTARK